MERSVNARERSNTCLVSTTKNEKGTSQLFKKLNIIKIGWEFEELEQNEVTNVSWKIRKPPLLKRENYFPSFVSKIFQILLQFRENTKCSNFKSFKYFLMRFFEVLISRKCFKTPYQTFWKRISPYLPYEINLSLFSHFSSKRWNIPVSMGAAGIGFTGLRALLTLENRVLFMDRFSNLNGDTTTQEIRLHHQYQYWLARQDNKTNQCAPTAPLQTSRPGRSDNPSPPSLWYIYIYIMHIHNILTF